jgi:hypothetical protein
MLPVSSLLEAPLRPAVPAHGDDARGGALLEALFSALLCLPPLLRGRHRDYGNGGGGVARVLTRSRARQGAIGTPVLRVALADRLLQVAQVFLHLAHGVLHIVDLGQRLVGHTQSLLRVDDWLRRLLLLGRVGVDLPRERCQIRERASRRQPPHQEIDANEAPGLSVCLSRHDQEHPHF